MKVRSRNQLHSQGRGRNYSTTRGLTEALLRVAYAGGWPARAWALVPGATTVTLLEHRIPISGWPRGAPPLRLAFVSDLHLGPTTPQATLDSAFALLAAARPDLLVLGGDYVFLDATEAHAAELRARVAAVPARIKVAVLGNHDLWARHELLERALADAGATLLVNDALRLPPPWDRVAIAGLDDPWTGEPDADRALARAGDAEATLAVCHSPDGLASLRGRAPLLVCGHTHGGQVALPGGRPLIVPGPQGKRTPHGLHQLGPTALFVSRGVGGIEVPVRTFARPDVALLTISG